MKTEMAQTTKTRTPEKHWEDAITYTILPPEERKVMITQKGEVAILLMHNGFGPHLHLVDLASILDPTKFNAAIKAYKLANPNGI